MFMKVRMLCSHAFYALKEADVYVIPPQYLLNHWLKNTEKMLLSANCSGLYNEKEKRNIKITEIWFEFNSYLSLAGVDEDLTDEVYSTIKELKDKLSSKGKNAKSSKKDFLSSVIRSQPSEVNVLPPKSSRNKGCGKRIMSLMETSEKEKKKARTCKTCGLICSHDSRNCPEKI